MHQLVAEAVLLAFFVAFLQSRLDCLKELGHWCLCLDFEILLAIFNAASTSLGVRESSLATYVRTQRIGECTIHHVSNTYWSWKYFRM